MPRLETTRGTGVPPASRRYTRKRVGAGASASRLPPVVGCFCQPGRQPRSVSRSLVDAISPRFRQPESVGSRSMVDAALVGLARLTHGARLRPRRVAPRLDGEAVGLERGQGDRAARGITCAEHAVTVESRGRAEADWGRALRRHSGPPPKKRVCARPRRLSEARQASHPRGGRGRARHREPQGRWEKARNRRPWGRSSRRGRLLGDCESAAGRTARRPCNHPSGALHC
jgi:hypothetical protein